MSLQYDRKAEDVLKFIDTRRAEQERYHDQKDKMAYAVAALMVAFATGYVAGNYPPYWFFTNKLISVGLVIVFVLVWGIAHFILCFQLECKRIAALDLKAFSHALFDAFTGKDSASFEHKTMEDRRQPCSVMKIVYTMMLCPQSAGLRDVPLKEGPAFLVDAYERAYEEGTYSTHVERAAWLLSILALIAILLKTLLACSSSTAQALLL